MNLAYQDMSPTEAHQINQANHRDLADRIKVFNRVEVSRNDVVDPRKQQPSLKTEHSQRQIELTEDDFIMFTIYMEQYRSPLFEEKKIVDHEFVFIKGSGKLTPLTYDAIRTFYKEKIDLAFIALFSHYRAKSNKSINNMDNITPHVGRHTWANITLEFIYNSLLAASALMALTVQIKK